MNQPRPDLRTASAKYRALAFGFAIAAVTALSLTRTAFAADDYPSRSIRLIVPFTPGGGSDVIGRLLADQLSRSMKQPFVIDNKPGAGGSIGTLEMVRAQPDGYTLLLATSSTHAINPAIYSKLDYDVLRDFAPISMLATTDYALGVAANSPYKTIESLLKAAATSHLQYASSGNGTTSQLAAALLASQTHTQLEHVPYKGSGPALNDVLGGQVVFLFDNTSVLAPQAQGGRLRLLATTGRERSTVAKSVPTLMESGLKDYEITGWWALVAPANTPPTIVERLNKETVQALNSPEVKAKLAAIGNVVYTSTPTEAKRFIESELKKFKAIVDIAGAKLD